MTVQSSSKSFQQIFGSDPLVRTEASGRVNLIGEHTDYNGGFVLPTAIPQKTRVELRARPQGDRLARVASANTGDAQIQEFELGSEKRAGGWTDYLMGVTQLLAKDGFKLGGFEARIESHVPMGSGLSSSAALEIAFTRALREAFRLDIDDVAMARLGQRVENEFVGARVGIMDQMACSLAGEHEALFLDTQDLSYRRVRLPMSRMDLLVINSGVSHSNVSGHYNQRRSECEQACEKMGVKLLRELGPQDLPRMTSTLPETLLKRARHVVTENARVLAAVEAIQKEDVQELGRLFDASHVSMRDDYQVSVPEIDTLVTIAREEGAIGARLTGGGFGGSVVVITAPKMALEISDRVCRRYSEATGRKPTVLVPERG